jgi:hypothetical protein
MRLAPKIALQFPALGLHLAIRKAGRYRGNANRQQQRKPKSEAHIAHRCFRRPSYYIVPFVD